MKVISLFSGAGGFDLGLIKSGHHVVFANDIDRDAVETYKKNIGKHIQLGDIRNISSPSIPRGDVVIGGFPCQGFSQANLRRSSKDERNILYEELVRVIRYLRPQYFLAENVRGILSLDNGAAIRKIINDLSQLRYRVETQLFNMADYGIPQNRWRVIIAGTRNDLPKELNYRFPRATHENVHGRREGGLFDKKLRPWITIGEALRNIPEPDLGPTKLKNHIYSKYKVTNRNFTGHRRTDPNKPSPTILARGNGKGGVCAIQHPGNHRRLTIRESAIIQTFPMSFAFVGSMNSCYRQVGNAVAVKFAQALGKQLGALENKIPSHFK
jgi:DNA (cytosine-5)-methyltransferase 1